MKWLTLIVGFVLIACLIGEATATSSGTKRLNIRQISDVPAGCLPADERENIALSRASVVDGASDGPPQQWVIELIPGARPVIIHPGECVAFGKPIDGYRQIGEFHPLEEGKTYSFGLRRGDRLNDWVSKSYSGMFCVRRDTDGRLAYLPYVDHPDGTTTYPPCGHYIGSPPAPDGINPLRP